MLLQIRPDPVKARPWALTPKVCSTWLNLALDRADSTTIGPASGWYSLTPLPKRNEGNQGTSKTPTPGDGGDVVGECSVHAPGIVVIPITLHEPEHEHGAHSGYENAQIDQKSDPCEGQGTLVQRLRDLVPESTFGGNLGVGGVFQDEVGEEQKLVGATEHGNILIGKSLQSLRLRHMFMVSSKHRWRSFNTN